jgi:hypothetical protein
MTAPLFHYLLDEHETPELVCEPIVIGDRAVVLAVKQASALVRIETQICKDRPVHLTVGPSQPSGWSVKRYL